MDADKKSRCRAIEIALEFQSRGWQPLPVPHKQKNPGFNGWQNFLTPDENSLRSHFNGHPMNIGVLLGSHSAGLVDIDCDCPEAMKLAPRLLPKTSCIFGRRGTGGRSHYLYVCDPLTDTAQFQETADIVVSGKKKRPKLVELRSTGAQTIMPSSTHPSGEAIEWAMNGEPTRIEGNVLHALVAKLAAASLLARHWPGVGSRHDAALSLAGGLRRAGWMQGDVENFVEAVADAAGDEQADDRRRAATDTFAAGRFTGWPALVEMMDAKTVSAVQRWLGILTTRSGPHAASAGIPRIVVAKKISDAWRPFPIESLPAVMRHFAIELSATLCVDPAMAALPMLSVAGAAIGNTARARMSADYHVPPNIWTAVVVRSGERKSPVLRSVMQPIYRRQAEAADEHAQTLAAYEGELEQWKAKSKSERGDKPFEPGGFPHFYLSDTTTEAIALRLQSQPRGLPLVLDELAGLFAGLNQYKNGKGNDRESYLAFYDAGPSKIDRKSSSPPTIFIPRAFVSISGMIQPGAAARAMGPAEFDSGLAARFLFASPPSLQAQWTSAGVSDEARDGWDTLLLGLLNTPLTDQPAMIPPSNAAMKLWSDAHDRLEADRHAEHDDRMRAARAKLIGAIPRLALILQCVSAKSGEMNATARVLDETSMGRAIALADWFTHETQRVYGLLTDDGCEDDLLTRIATNGGNVSIRELMRWSREFRTAGLAESYLDSLAREGIGRWAWADQHGRGQPRRVFILARADADANAAGDAKNRNIVSVSA